MWGGGEFSSRHLWHRALVAGSLITASSLPAAQAWTAARTATANAGVSDASAIAVDAAGNQYVTGKFNDNMQLGSFALTLTSGSVAASNDVFVAKYSPAGVYLWAMSFSGDGDDIGRCIQADAAGNVVVSGIFTSPTFGGTLLNHDPSNDSNNIFLAKLNGNTDARIWLTGGGGGSVDPSHDYVNSLALDAAGNAYIAGAFQ